MIENIGAYSQVDYDRGYQQGRADAYEEVYNRIDEGLCELCECADTEGKCYKNCNNELNILKKWLKGKINE